MTGFDQPIDMSRSSATDDLRERLVEARDPDVILTPVEGGEPMPADEYDGRDWYTERALDASL